MSFRNDELHQLDRVTHRLAGAAYLADQATKHRPFPQLHELVGHGMPMSTPSFRGMFEAWHAVTKATDPFLDSLTTETLQNDLPVDGKPSGQTIGSAIRRVTYHYWYHIGEIQAIRQMLDHSDLPQYVGDIEAEAPYRPE